MHQPEAYVIQTDPFFAQLKAWGNTIWDLWWHNKDIPAAAPFLMTQATLGVGGCTAPVPTLNLATPSNQEVTLEWSNEHSADSSVVGYKIYYDQAGKAQLIADVGLITTYTDTGLTNGQEYCYKVTSSYADCESDLSNIECATPQNQGQTTDPAGVVAMETGYYSGKGKNKTWNVSNTFAPGDTVVIRAIVYDITNNVPLSNATMDIVVGGPETATLTSGPSDADGITEATWQTQKPNKKGQGGTTSRYLHGFDDGRHGLRVPLGQCDDGHHVHHPIVRDEKPCSGEPTQCCQQPGCNPDQCGQHQGDLRGKEVMPIPFV